MNDFKKLLLAAGLVVILVLLWLPRGATPPQISLPPEADAFVSYHLAVQSAANGLTTLPSRQQFETLQVQIDGKMDEVAAARQRLSDLTAKKKLQVTMDHAIQIERTKKALRQLVKWNKENPAILGDDWEQYAVELGTADASDD